MLYLQSPSTDPHFNLALEEMVFETMDPGESYFMLWQNDNAVIVGRYQDTAREVNRAFVEQNGVRVVRRLSGGGAVYHDLGNLNFTYIVDAGAAGLDFALFCAPVAAALRAFGANAKVSGRNDITIDGAKFSGNAQYRRRGRVLHHGTILFDSDLSMVQKALNVSPAKYQGKGVASVRSRVTNLKPHLSQDVSLAEFRAMLVEEMFRQNPLTARAFTEAELARAEALRQSRYGQWEWNWGASPAASLQKTRRFDGVGEITLHLDLDKGRIRALAATGDYFSGGDPADLARLLAGCKLEAGAVNEALAGVDVGQYFNNLTREQFVSLLLE